MVDHAFSHSSSTPATFQKFLICFGMNVNIDMKCSLRLVKNVPECMVGDLLTHRIK